MKDADEKDEYVEHRAERLADAILDLLDERDPGLLLYASCIAMAELIRRMSSSPRHAVEGVTFAALELHERVGAALATHRAGTA